MAGHGHDHVSITSASTLKGVVSHQLREVKDLISMFGDAMNGGKGIQMRLGLDPWDFTVLYTSESEADIEQ
ncbi:hypothetical protein N7491_005172 [Penicillium cf. griseofulvum]|uniref:Uncharacterized protein n=1 Tax=Penicillium cf. griseofulvum TaxID=2972120 RepID=A0A9W9J737_9EURO|nr:hypothetical protein N7472_007865 [Penicillium cf. griseofulvum]KAJ5434577.1 hypothetical protein N7491_005172 [Penicillium cf. griseofulvum]KAJ5452406.1 hypothetical protein N7445_000589 [Penicillium cf. griseofulvum]